MKRWVFIGLLSLVSAAWADTPPPKVIHKVLVLALGRDGTRATQIEADIQGRFVQRGVVADGAHAVIPTTLSLADMQGRIQAKKYDGVLCMGPRPTIRIQPLKSNPPMLDDCLTSYITGKRNGEVLEVNPYTIDGIGRQNSPGNPGLLKTPMHTNPDDAKFRLYKGTLRLFDASNGQLLWEKDDSTKIPVGVREAMELPLIASVIWDAIDKSGFLPTSPASKAPTAK